MKKKVFAILLSLAMIITMMPAFAIIAFAEGEQESQGGGPLDPEQHPSFYKLEEIYNSVANKLEWETLSLSIVDPEVMSDDLKVEARENLFDYLANIQKADDNNIGQYDATFFENGDQLSVKFSAVLQDADNGMYFHKVIKPIPKQPVAEDAVIEGDDEETEENDTGEVQNVEQPFFVWSSRIENSWNPNVDKIEEVTTIDQIKNRSLRIRYIASFEIFSPKANYKFESREIKAMRGFSLNLIEKGNETIDQFIAGTSDLRKGDWEYNDLRLLNVLAHKMDDYGEGFNCSHPESFFGGEFRDRYNQLVGDGDDLSIEAFIPTGFGRGDLLQSYDNYQALYYTTINKEKTLYFIDNLYSGDVAYQYMLLVKSGNGNIIDKANIRMSDYFKETGYSAVASDYGDLILTDKGVAIKQENGNYELVDGCPEFLFDKYKDNFNSMFDSIGNVTLEIPEYNPDGSPAEPETASAKGYKLYKITVSNIENGNSITYPFIIGRVNSLDKEDKAAYAEVTKALKEGNIGAVKLEGLNGAVPFDTYAEISETRDVKSTLDEPYTAVEVTAESNMSADDAKGGIGYKMQVTLSDVTINEEALKQGDNFKVWDNENECFLKNGDGEAFAVSNDGEVVFTATHFSTYAIVKTDEEVKPHVHVWDNGTVTKEPTSTTSGIRTYKCTMCGESKTEDIPCINIDSSAISTGDSTNVMPYAILGGVALLALLGLVIAKKRRAN